MRIDKALRHYDITLPSPISLPKRPPNQTLYPCLCTCTMSYPQITNLTFFVQPLVTLVDFGLKELFLRIDRASLPSLSSRDR